MIKFQNVTNNYLEDAIALATSDYASACTYTPALSKVNAAQTVRKLLPALFQNGLGKLAFNDDKLIGYLAFFGPFEGFHGKVTGAFSPLAGSAFASESDAGISRDKLITMLLAEVAQDFMDKGIFQMALSQYAHDTLLGRALVLNGFGIRCSDSVMSLTGTLPIPKDLTAFESSLIFREVPLKDRLLLLPLKKALILHLGSAPSLFPAYLSKENIEGQLQNPDIRFFAAFDKEIPVAI